jgi:hypothetical protein
MAKQPVVSGAEAVKAFVASRLASRPSERKPCRSPQGRLRREPVRAPASRAGTRYVASADPRCWYERRGVLGPSVGRLFARATASRGRCIGVHLLACRTAGVGFPDPHAAPRRAGRDRPCPGLEGRAELVIGRQTGAVAALSAVGYTGIRGLDRGSDDGRLEDSCGCGRRRCRCDGRLRGRRRLDAVSNPHTVGRKLRGGDAGRGHPDPHGPPRRLGPQPPPRPAVGTR